MLVSICKKKTQYYYDKDKKIQEKLSIDYNFTIDFRFIDGKLVKNFVQEFKRVGENPKVFEEESIKAEKLNN